MDMLPPDVWIDRCARRIVEIDRRIKLDEAVSIARDLRAFERTAMMEPEKAVDFVASALARGQRSNFERRSVSRTCPPPRTHHPAMDH